jgi:hypothetical protein
MLRQIFGDSQFFERPDCGLLRVRADVGIVLEHLIANVSCLT